MAIYGGIEAGGTKFICAVGDGLGTLGAFVRFATTTPEETLGRAVHFFEGQGAPVAAVGIGSFGPIDLDPESPGYGHVTTTPKPGWRGADVRGTLARALGVPVAFTTDVGAALVGEAAYGAASGCRQPLYLTVGTGIGGALLTGGPHPHGALLGGLTHPEMGHIPVPRMPGDAFAGVCPYHGDCLEGLASGPAIGARAGRSAEGLPPDDPAWAFALDALGAGVAALALALSPDRIVAGGGVLSAPHVWPRLRAGVERRLGGYVDHPALAGGLARYLVPPALGGRAGVLGALALARAAHKGP